ncbi:hypothetical protein [Azospirillum argentinense]|uniref:hypothetical protein n=1 Tax=Azospirillum argentinense TaxID=2970906 RepID=UPI0010C12F15|nr:hypothetical protein [Azospirillum argentinense]
MGLLDDARKNPSVDALYIHIDAQTPIKFVESADEVSWSSTTMGGGTTITGAPTKHPDASLAHELLHAKLKINGYRQYGATTAMHHKYRAANIIAQMLDNELQHHRMYSEFLNIGFKAEQFYNDDDIKSYRKVRRELKAMGQTTAREEFLRAFVTVIAPGGAGTEDERIKLRNFLRARCGKNTWDILIGIENEIAGWVAQPSPDSGSVLVNIFRLLGGYDSTWIGWTADSFPANGIFVGQPFTLQQATTWLALHAH